MMNIEYSQQASILIIYFAAIVGLGLLINAITIFSIGLALYCSHCHLQHEIASLKQETPDLSNSLLETVTRERDALRAELAALRRSTHGPLPVGATDAISRGPSPISPSTPAPSSFLQVTNVLSATPPSAALQPTGQPTVQPAATIPLTPSFTNTPTDKHNLSELTVAPTTRVITPQPINQVALAAEARFGLINRPASAASAQFATTTQSPPTFTATPASMSTTSITNINSAAGATCALIKRAPAAVSPSTPTPLPRPVATPFVTPITLTTKPSPANLTPSRLPRLTSPRSNKPSPLGRSWVTAPSTPSPSTPAQPLNAKPTTVKPTTPTPKSTYTPDKATLAAAAILGLISRGSAGKGPFTPTKLPVLDKTPTKTPTATPTRTLVKASPILANLSPSKMPLPSPDCYERAFFAEEKYLLNAKPTTVKPATPTPKSTYTPDKATLAAAAILGLISRGSAGKGPFTPTKIPGLDKTPTKTPIATPTRTQANLTPTKMPLPSPDCYERAFFAEEKYFAKLPFPKTFRPDLKNPQF
ncbi:hypothetical protein HDU77_011297 [Chytriomyces hyalinus]|nr:hypothetical protein HDU77_011297 [Chytriomyces hyalinus]